MTCPAFKPNGAGADFNELSSLRCRGNRKFLLIWTGVRSHRSGRRPNCHCSLSSRPIRNIFEKLDSVHEANLSRKWAGIVWNWWISQLQVDCFSRPINREGKKMWESGRHDIFQILTGSLSNSEIFSSSYLFSLPFRHVLFQSHGPLSPAKSWLMNGFTGDALPWT